MRGVHLLPLHELLGLQPRRETVERFERREGLELDLVTHDARKFFLLLLERNGNVLEQLYSPLILRTSPEHEELKRIARGCITRHHARHYLGYANRQWALFARERPRRLKPLLYVYRVLLTGLHLVRTGEVESNLEVLDASFRLPHLAELIQRKRSGPENGTCDDVDLDFHLQERNRLAALLVEESARSPLPEAPTCRDELDALLKRLRGV